MKSKSPCWAAFSSFEQEVKKASGNYTKFWHDFLKEFGFKIIPSAVYPEYHFDIESAGKEFSCCCYPTIYQGFKIAVKGASNEQKIYSESGIIKFMRRNNIPIP